MNTETFQHVTSPFFKTKQNTLLNHAAENFIVHHLSRQFIYTHVHMYALLGDSSYL